MHRCLLVLFLLSACAIGGSGGPMPESSQIGKADLDQARALLARARNELEPKQWELLERKITETERSWERFAVASRPSGKEAKVPRGVAVGLAGAEAEVGTAIEGATLGPLLVLLVGLWP